VDLRGERVCSSRTVDARAIRKDRPELAVMSSSDPALLSAGSTRELTFEAYRNAGREIARELVSNR
jgi:hypothetical protein